MKKILVANRGEIAIRVMRTAQKMGIKTVAVYSTADRNAPHVKFADEAVCIGEAPSSQSYLLGNKIIAVAKSLGVDAIHPGYGFLSENSEFAEEAEKNNITFIGPKSKAILIMGSKLAAKEAVKAYDIPMVPGVDEAITDIAKAKEAAQFIGFPILIKASAGGGGKGMRVVETEAEFESQMNRAISEAVAAFGDGSVFIEKYVASPRHIEIQIMADSHGNILYLFERECSVQRRHQKVVEEAPSAVLTPELRKKMGEAAVLVAKSCDYLGAGTVEFLLDENHNFYFLEMNTRLQVEHPVTEIISGVDLVEMQIRVARGEALTLKQEDLQIKGHALELRVYAEDPLNDFLPSVGHLDQYILPTGKGVRVDNGFEQGMDIPIYYDPMLSKLITYGETREEAMQIMLKAIEDYKIQGVSTTLPFGKFVFEHEAFRSGNFDTHFVKKYYDAEVLKKQMAQEAEIAALVALKQYFEDQKIVRLPNQ
ncbi:acetyl-CoA carboxylase biotin carboxylase subunit [Flavobacterium branchiophilum NBRC 15030 = ATCC 35035]|uniref:Acetyl-CoA carboxylase biotin carboxylase subunit n=1 Tax=Flavobacterium branchiophilum TaxID=55197 RepID=A0A2H3KUD0_9FLAO|nr:acetyl-CoA carboxylase biotin carboxylase subunit [Flavobacterium branchiophilum]OXA79751.1 acetyl-CoA carboxylase biotin carboxylase subunit [Flavobacterium branchiophilum NBRC 15030 = ATCC 35035]PDS21887.1 acetyl-CoA carboxylase biotin carboxylase subunit [Flavobacterium branchiophilum]TQM41315.1 propionyl-CoA carboxylase alpha chain [Flavobacterium branchiophilum]GEM56083.1 acetyl-CoA carboxylase biotin carboxylase subunit [Flavobacterium branchiophilum NBRC 15030 = ATCC 35035]